MFYAFKHDNSQKESVICSQNRVISSKICYQVQMPVQMPVMSAWFSAMTS